MKRYRVTVVDLETGETHEDVVEASNHDRACYSSSVLPIKDHIDYMDRRNHREPQKGLLFDDFPFPVVDN